MEQDSFIDFLKSGWDINLACAIDFTASNRTLHDIDENGSDKNDYELSILEVGKILQPFCYKKEFSAYGFGAIPHFLFDQDMGFKKDEVDINCFCLGREPIKELDVLIG